MPTHALRTVEAPSLIRFLDLAVLALALPVFIAADLPLLGWGAVAAFWVVQRFAHDMLGRRAGQADPRRATMLLAVSMMVRVWLLALVIFAVGSADRDAGLSAAVLSVILVTAYLVGLMTSGPAFPGAKR